MGANVGAMTLPGKRTGCRLDAPVSVLTPDVNVQAVLRAANIGTVRQLRDLDCERLLQVPRMTRQMAEGLLRAISRHLKCARRVVRWAHKVGSLPIVVVDEYEW